MILFYLFDYPVTDLQLSLFIYLIIIIWFLVEYRNHRKGINSWMEAPHETN